MVTLVWVLSNISAFVLGAVCMYTACELLPGDGVVIRLIRFTLAVPIAVTIALGVKLWLTMLLVG